MSNSLLARTASVADRAVAAYAGSPVEAASVEIRRRLDLPVQVAIAGKVKVGKSTLLNALVGEELAPTNASECTRIVTWYRRAEVTQVTAVPYQGSPHPVAFSRNGALDVELGAESAESLRWLMVDWPTERLRAMTLVDTPGIASLSTDLSQRTTAFLDPTSEDPGTVDAVIYLMRHMHTADVRLLESFHDHDLAQPNPVNCIAVLSRADEIGVCRLDAMKSAHAIADRYIVQPSIRRLVQDVVPVAGLLAQAAVSLREEEFRFLRSMAQAGVRSNSPVLGSVQELSAADTEIDDVVSASVRRALVERFGLFGVRWAMEWLSRAPEATATELAEALAKVSGLTHLREIVMQQIAARSGLLKARSAMTALTRLAATNPVNGLSEELEALAAGAHELAELRMLNALRLGAVPLKDDQLAEAEQILERSGQAAAARIGLPPDAEVGEVRRKLLASLETWQKRAENPLSKQAVVDACRVLIRSYEGMLTDLAG
ncbi:MAG: 50S ribosome-binding GTPase [Frankiaceae bacterium]|nr:50S ribosome-binding GTPase [Frankiaceae bacterium]MBV9872834.1 50S ribosome-binding GTPase [Frankiaceae bacterium]